jgi:hypothetical protein
MHNVATEVGEHGCQRTELDRCHEGRPPFWMLRIDHTQHGRGDRQVGSAGDRDEFCETLYNSQDQGNDR